MINQKDIRTYEISIWTLQDSFITVLKWANLEQKGQVQNPILTLDVDGTQTLSFSIPMYLNIPNGTGAIEKKENPIWYNTQNGNLMTNMRKIKVILNKKLNDEKIYEFVIIKVLEKHEKGQLYCDVNCEGLAFQELGKIGYKFNLSAEDYQNDYEDWITTGSWQDSFGENRTDEPKQNLQYWNEKLLLNKTPQTYYNMNPNKWYYSIQMDQSSIGDSSLESNKVYENEYISSWKIDEDTGNLMPTSISSFKEKQRSINLKESNIYNLTQNIAKTFEVFCRYEYKYDSNYHIISREIIYYNNFIKEQEGSIDLTYPYQTTQITREMDSTDLITKMFVQDQSSDNGILSIMNVEANRSREDYILNFDYLYKLGAITEEQYEEVEKFESKMFEINTELETLGAQINVIKNQINEKEANKSVAEKAKAAAAEQMEAARKEITSNFTQNGIVTIDGYNSKLLFIVKESNKDPYVDIPFVGVVLGSVKLFKGPINYNGNHFNRNQQLAVCSDFYDYDVYDNLIRIYLPSIDVNDIDSVYLQCKYMPYKYWESVYEYWERQYNDQSAKVTTANTILQRLTTDLNIKEATYNNYLIQQKETRKKFEYIMGPAIREGYWQPKDYRSYSDKHFITFNNSRNQIKKENITYEWDMNLFDDEEGITYQQGNSIKYYTAIILTDNQFNYISDNLDDVSLVYYDANVIDTILSYGNSLSADEKEMLEYNAKRIIQIGGQCRLGFLKLSSQTNARPALIILDSVNFSSKQNSFFRDSQVRYKYRSYIRKTSEEIAEFINNEQSLIDENYVIDQHNYEIETHYSLSHLRIKIDTLNVNTSSSELFIKLNNEYLLTEYEDFYINKDYNNVYVTIKPEVLFKIKNYNPSMSISYSLSQTELGIYLDAVQIAKENSQPKVAYTVDLNIFDEALIKNIYNKLSNIVHINDVDLKFRNVQGYISKIELDLAHPWQDKIEIKNYKTKFEDLFSTIVAQTEQMQRNNQVFNLIAANFNADGTLNPSLIDLDSQTTSTLELVETRLQEVFNEAGSLLSNAGNSLVDMRSLSIANSNILSGFYNGVQEGFRNGIDYTQPIGLVAGDQIGNISVVRINKDEGIFLGSNKKIILSSSNAIKDANGNYINTKGEHISSADVELSPERLLLGVSNLSDNNVGVVDITSKYTILSVGSNVDIIKECLENGGTFEIFEIGEYVRNNYTTVEEVQDKLSELQVQFSSQNLTELQNLLIDNLIPRLSGVAIKKDYIGLATGDSNNRSLVSITPIDITLGTSTNNKQGSYVKIQQTGLEIGSTANIWIGTQNLRLITDVSNSKTVFAVGNDLTNIGLDTKFENGKFYKVNSNNSQTEIKDTNNNNPPDGINLFVNNNTAYFKGAVYASSGSFTGDVYANSFQLNGKTFAQAVGETELARNLVQQEIRVSYYASTNSLEQDDLSDVNDWKSSTDAAIQGMSKPYYLYTRSKTFYANNSTSVAYSISYVGADGTNGTNGIYVTEITSLYYLSNNFNWSQKPAAPAQKVTSSSDGIDIWTTVIPTFNESYKNASPSYYYYRCDQYIWSDSTDSNTHVTWSEVRRDPGLTALNQYVTEAGKAAADAVLAIAPITAYGLIGYKTDGDSPFNGRDPITGITYENGYPIWNRNPYGLILGNNQVKPLLIGSNGGITIVADSGHPEYGEAIAMSNGGISLFGDASIQLITSSNGGTNVVSLDSEGITIASTGKLEMDSGNFSVQASQGSFRFGDGDNVDFWLEGEQLYCRRIVCEELVVQGTLTSPESEPGSGSDPGSGSGSQGTQGEFPFTSTGKGSDLIPYTDSSSGKSFLAPYPIHSTITVNMGTSTIKTNEDIFIHLDFNIVNGSSCTIDSCEIVQGNLTSQIGILAKGNFNNFNLSEGNHILKIHSKIQRAALPSKYSSESNGNKIAYIGVRLGCASNTSGTFTIRSWSDMSTSPTPGSYLSKAPVYPSEEYIDLT